MFGPPVYQREAMPKRETTLSFLDILEWEPNLAKPALLRPNTVALKSNLEVAIALTIFNEKLKRRLEDPACGFFVSFSPFLPPQRQTAFGPFGLDPRPIRRNDPVLYPFQTKQDRRLEDA